MKYFNWLMEHKDGTRIQFLPNFFWLSLTHTKRSYKAEDYCFPHVVCHYSIQMGLQVVKPFGKKTNKDSKHITE